MLLSPLKVVKGIFIDAFANQVKLSLERFKKIAISREDYLETDGEQGFHHMPFCLL